MDEAVLRAYARRFVGCPFLELGADPSGWDCWGLVQYVGRDLGLWDFPSYAEAYRQAGGTDAARAAAAINAHLGDWRRLPRVMPGTVLLFRRFGQPRHVGLAMNRREMLHVSEDMTGGTTIERFDTIVWSRLFDGAYLPREGI